MQSIYEVLEYGAVLSTTNAIHPLVHTSNAYGIKSSQVISAA
jgi:hypothetical protein